MQAYWHKPKRRTRRGVAAVLVVMLLVVLMGMVAFAVDVGYMSLTKSELQNAADAAALAAVPHIPSNMSTATAAAEQFASRNRVAGEPVPAESVQIEFGDWNRTSRTFTERDTPGNAVRVTLERSEGHGGEVGLFFASVFGLRSFMCNASSVATISPRDIAFVIDLSGSMNNDTEPCWATDEINATFAPDGYPTVGTELMQQLYDDFNFGAFPGTTQYVGQPLGVGQDQYAYAELTKNSGPLSQSSIPSTYRIGSSDSESTRKTKAYKWMIDYQIATIMPNARPVPASGNTASYNYWTRYLDFMLRSQQITSSSPKGRPRPSYPVTLPPSQSSDRITSMGNPYTDAFPDADPNAPGGYRNKIGYRTYAQFMMDFGRNMQPASGQYVQLSVGSPYCPRHTEATAGGDFSFPPREQPTHAAKRALIAAMQVIKERNQEISDPSARDWVSLVTFDTVSGATLRQSLTADYDAAMLTCVDLQAVGDNVSSTATETGLILAKNHIASPDDGGQGRRYTNKVVVLLTDGIPNLYSSSNPTISGFVSGNPSPNWYGGSSYSKNAPLMQSMSMQQDKWQMFPVGLGLGTDYDFMDRMARMGGTANPSGEAARGSGNPAEYEERLTEIFESIITNHKARIVQ